MIEESKQTLKIKVGPCVTVRDELETKDEQFDNISKWERKHNVSKNIQFVEGKI